MLPDAVPAGCVSPAVPVLAADAGKDRIQVSEKRIVPLKFPPHPLKRFFPVFCPGMDVPGSLPPYRRHPVSPAAQVPLNRRHPMPGYQRGHHVVSIEQNSAG